MTKNQLVLFTAMMLVIGFVCRWSDPSVKDFNSQSLGMIFWLISPFILMLIFRAINKDWRSLGVKLQFQRKLALVYYLILVVSDYHWLDINHWQNH